MERVLENDIVGQLFESRFSQYSENYVKQNNNLEDMELERNKLLSLIKKIVPNEEEQKKAIEQISSYDKNMRFWNKKCYEWGFYDRLEVRNPYLVELLKDKIRNKEAKKTCFLSEMFEDFTFYFEEQRKRLIYCREDYKEIRKIINDLCEKYPRIRDFIEENIFSDFNKDEQKALLEINQQFCNMINIVIEEVYKLGLEEDRL